MIPKILEKTLDQGEKSDKIQKNNFSPNLNHVQRGPPAKNMPLRYSYTNKRKIEKNRTQGGKLCPKKCRLQPHFKRNPPLKGRTETPRNLKNPCEKLRGKRPKIIKSLMSRF